MSKGRTSQHNRSVSIVMKYAVIFAAVLFSAYACSNGKVEQGPTEAPPAEVAAAVQPSPVPTASDYSKFTHSNPAHDALPCLICHTREEGVTRASFPGKDGHLPCAGCHAVEFEKRSQSTMCSICHTDAEKGGLKTFPPLRSFNARFDHGRHLRQTNCATCHKPSRQGVALSIPAGSNAHATCFTCHGPQATSGDQNIASCKTCHQPGRPPATSDWARSFSVGFSHADHRRGNLNCSACHSIKAGAARGDQATAPKPVMHFASGRSQSCGTCHNDKRAFGGQDFANCKRCHEGNNFGS